MSNKNKSDSKNKSKYLSIKNKSDSKNKNKYLSIENKLLIIQIYKITKLKIYYEQNNVLKYKI